MQPEARKYLFDIQQAIDRLLSYTAGKDFQAYMADDLLRSAVERQFTVIGEAVTQLGRADVTVVEQLTNHRHIIGFRNRLVHLYADVDHMLLWEILSTDLLVLRNEVESLLRSRD